NETATHLLILSSLTAVVMNVALLVFTDPILQWLDCPENIMNDSRAYLQGIAFDFIGMFLLSLFHAIHQANGDSKSGVLLNSISAVLNIILDPIFIFVLDMGVLGAALATSLSKFLLVPVVIYRLYQNEQHGMTTIAFRKYPLTLRSIKEIMTVTIPASVGQFFTAFGFVLMNKAIIYYGAVAMSAYGLGSRIAGLFYIPVNAIGGALSAFIGQSLGAEDIPHAKDCFKKSMQLCAGISVVITVFGWVACPHIIPLFVKDASEELLALATEYSFYSVATAFFMGWYGILSGVFNGSGHTRSTLVLAVFRLWGCRIPMIYLFRALGFGPTGIWWAMVLSNLFCCAAGQILYQTGRWQTRKLAK
ncbi:MAG: MATE family efflux transporter, partial [Oscillospiraceae bacterium]|nr:MATE family efflux transporter [Oscillospiraceae bacterium]